MIGKIDSNNIGFKANITRTNQPLKMYNNINTGDLLAINAPVVLADSQNTGNVNAINADMFLFGDTVIGNIGAIQGAMHLIRTQINGTLTGKPSDIILDHSKVDNLVIESEASPGKNDINVKNVSGKNVQIGHPSDGRNNSSGTITVQNVAATGDVRIGHGNDYITSSSNDLSALDKTVFTLKAGNTVKDVTFKDGEGVFILEEGATLEGEVKNGILVKK